MLSQRPYRDAVGLSLALDELDRCAGTQFDRRVVESIRLVLTRSSDLAA
jgi:HD-GYP domain-containing protein (c-di-GMP phosphodiesterase class II)